MLEVEKHCSTADCRSLCLRVEGLGVEVAASSRRGFVISVTSSFSAMPSSPRLGGKQDLCLQAKPQRILKTARACSAWLAMRWYTSAVVMMLMSVAERVRPVELLRLCCSSSSPKPCGLLRVTRAQHKRHCITNGDAHEVECHSELLLLLVGGDRLPQ